jgi:hypothetical protein
VAVKADGSVVTLAVNVGMRVLLTVIVREGVFVRVRVLVNVKAGVIVRDPVLVAVEVRVNVDVKEDVRVGLRLAVKLGVRVNVDVDVEVRVGVGVVVQRKSRNDGKTPERVQAERSRARIRHAKILLKYIRFSYYISFYHNGRFHQSD